MMERAVQIAIRNRLTGTPAVTALVAAGKIRDVGLRPKDFPTIALGESQTVDEGTSLKRSHTRVYHTLHVWVKEPTLELVKVICAAIRLAIHSDRLDLGTGFHCADALVSSMRQIRDPDGETSHGIVTVEVLVAEVAP